MDGIPTPGGTGTTTGTQSSAYLSQQYQLAQCFQNRAIVDQALTEVGMVPVDDTATAPFSFRSCN